MSRGIVARHVSGHDADRCGKIAFRNLAKFLITAV
jgi:hypothetical protein